MKFLASVVAWFKALFSVFGDGVDKSTDELTKYREDKIDIDRMLRDFRKQSETQLAQQNAILDERTKAHKQNEKKLAAEKSVFENSIQSLYNVEVKLKDESLPQDKREEMENDIPYIRQESRIASRRVKMYQEAVSRGKVVVEELRKSVRENDLKARGIVAELEDLASRKDLIDSWQSIEGIKLIGDYSLQDIIRIVEGKESLFEAKQENDKILNRGDANIIDKYSQGGDAELDTEIEAALEAMRNKNA